MAKSTHSPQPRLPPLRPGLHIRWGLEAFFPSRCVSCRELIDDLDRCGVRLFMCAVCRNSLQPVTAPTCRRCGVSLGAAPGRALEPHCLQCLQRTPAFDSACASFEYGAAIQAALLNSKLTAGPGRHFTQLLSLCSEFGASPPRLSEEDRVVPVPLSRQRLAQRGFNQAVLLALALVGPQGRSQLTDILRRRRDTPPQRGLRREHRRRNVRRAFCSVGGESLVSRRVWLVDDVLTTGATADACAQVLKRAGAAQVHVWTVARTMPT